MSSTPDHARELRGSWALVFLLALQLALPTPLFAAKTRLFKSDLPTTTVHTNDAQDFTEKQTFSAGIQMGSFTPTVNGEIGWSGTEFLFREGGTNKTLSSLGGDFSGDFNDSTNGAISHSVNGFVTFTDEAQGPDGSTSVVTWGFTNDPDTGLYRVGNNSPGIVAGGTVRITVQSDGDTVFQNDVQVPNGSASDPTHTFVNDPNTGMFRVSADRLGLTAGGSAFLEAISSGVIYIANEISFDGNGSATDPVVTWTSDTDLGLFRIGADDMGFTAGGLIASVHTGGFDVDSGSFKVHSGYVEIAEQSEPSTPGPNDVRIYVDSTSGEVTAKKDTGTTVSLEGGGSEAGFNTLVLAAEPGVQDIRTPSASNVTFVGGTNGVTISALAFDKDDDEFSVHHSQIPPNFDASSSENVIVTLYWLAETAATANVVWKLEYNAVNNAESFDTAFTTDTATAAANTSTDYLVETTFSDTPANWGFAAGDFLNLHISRDADSGSDTLSSDALLVAVSIKYPVAGGTGSETATWTGNVNDTTSGDIYDSTGDVTVDDDLDVNGHVEISDYIELAEVSAPGTAAANTQRLYTKSGGGLYMKDDTGTEVQVASTSSGVVVQSQLTESAGIGSCATQIPTDDTVPQSTEGCQVMTASFTPTDSSNILYITSTVSYGQAGAQGTQALFKDSDSSALAAIGTHALSGSTHVNTLTHKMTAGTTSAITFKMRVGRGFAGTLYYNNTGDGTTQDYGGIAKATILIMEVTP